MFRKALLALFCVVMLVLASGAAPVFANGSPPPIQNVFTPSSPTAEEFDIQEFNSSLYLAVSDEVNGGQIWRSKNGSNWEPATGLGFGIGPSYSDSWDMTVFKGKLYVATNCYPNQSAACPGVVLRSSNGKDWEQIPLPTGTSLLDKLGVFDGMIYATSIWTGGQIWRSRTGNPGTWEAVKDIGFGDFYGSSSPTEFNGQVYFSVDAHGDSVYIWHSRDGRHWATDTLKITDQDPSMGFTGDSTMYVYKGDLYLAVTNSLDGGTIYRSKDGRNWKKVIVGDPAVIGYRDFMAYDGFLYVTTFNFDGSFLGVRLWRSHSGNLGSWERFDPDPADWGAFNGAERGTMAVLKGSLYIYNSGGGVFRMKTD